ncbi:MAG: class I SAM-dependent methyltransferase, partial [Deltaproteobacteria bacterium]|nr:class I SAM-dependent methyltransferase [Deltaproteobacteria bacterium]
YREVADIHELPEIAHYWSNRHLRPRLNSVFGTDGVADFFARPLARCVAGGTPSDPAVVVSVGSGDASVELAVARRLRELGAPPFRIHCLEVSPVLLARAEEAVARAGLGDCFHLEATDLNRWSPSRRYAGAMAHHSLHHLVELERIFDGLAGALEPGGAFVANDMIGRNGHMRWPETLEVIERIWAFLDDRYKVNRQLRRLESEFVNWDCSTEGFEGVRAQDILPLLIERFQFDAFLAVGGITDVFVDRSFGHNYDPDDARDRAFIDFLQYLNDQLIDSGAIKPTTLFAVASVGSAGDSHRFFRHWDARHAVRPPG